MSEPFVDYPRANLSGTPIPTTLEELRAMRKMRLLCVKALALPMLLGPVFWMFVPLIMSAPFSRDWPTNVFFGPFAIGHLIATVLTYRAVRAAEPYRPRLRNWALSEAMIVFLLPCVGMLVPLVNAAWSAQFFRSRKISLGFVAPADEDLVAWASRQPAPLSRLESEP